LAHFDDSFIASFDLFEEYVARLTLALFRTTGLEAACRDEVTPSEALAHAGLVPQVALVPVSWMLAMLASRNWIGATIGADGQRRYRVTTPVPDLDADEILQRQQAH